MALTTTQQLLNVSAAGASIAAGQAKPSKPNLLFIWTDEQRADTLAAYGNGKIHAPALNKLAGESSSVPSAMMDTSAIGR